MSAQRPDELSRLRQECDALSAVNRQLYGDILRLLDLQEAIRAIVDAADRNALVRAALRGACAVTSAAWARWYQRDTEAEATLHLVALNRQAEHPVTGCVAADGIPALVIRRRRTVWCEDTRSDRRYLPEADRLCGCAAACTLTVPVRLGGGQVAALEVVHGAGCRFDDEGKDRLETLALVTGLQLERLYLGEQIPTATNGRASKARPLGQSARPRKTSQQASLFMTGSTSDAAVNGSLRQGDD